MYAHLERVSGCSGIVSSVVVRDEDWLQFKAMGENTAKNMNFKLYKWLGHQ